MLQATEFIMQKQRELMKREEEFMHEGEQEEQQQQSAAVDKAMDTLASTLGNDGRYILVFRKKFLSNPVAIIKDPAAAMKKMAQVMSGLVSKDAAKKEEAQQVVDSMSEGNGTHLTKEDEAEVKKALDKSSKEEPPSTAGDERRAWRGIEGALLGNDKSASKARQIMAQTEPVVEAPDVPASLLQLQVDQMQDLSMELATGAFNLSKVVVVLLWILFISSTIAVITIVVLSLNNIITELALWMQIAGYTFWYSGIALAFKGLYEKNLAAKNGWRSVSSVLKRTSGCLAFAF